MELHANDKQSDKYKLIDLDTNQEIQLSIWANDDTGDYIIRIPSDDPKDVIMKDKYGFIGMLCNGNIKLIKK